MIYPKRINVLLFIFLGAFGLILLRLFSIQALQAPKYRELARDRILRTRTLPTSRGTITDRNGVPLAISSPTVFAIAVRPGEFGELPADRREALLQELAAVYGTGADVLRARLDHIRARLDRQIARDLSRMKHSSERKRRRDELSLRRLYYREPQQILTNIPFPEAMTVELEPERFPGVTAVPDTTRRHPLKSLAMHVLGRTSVMWQENWDAYRAMYPDDPLKQYRKTDAFGVSGLEKAFEDRLRGRRGQRTEVIDRRERPHMVLRTLPAETGRMLRTTLDYRIQRTAEDVLAPYRGAAVVMDVRNGALLCLASSPTYDPTEPLGPLLDPERHPDRPLLRRATAGLYPPGSTFKIVDTLAGLESRTITPDTHFTCERRYRVADQTFSCLGYHSDIALEYALAKSCNVYFYKAGNRIGPTIIETWAKALGLGEHTGIEIGDSAGRCYGPSTKQPWYVGDTANQAIGQGRMLVTPLQMARLVATIANGGTLQRPHLALTDDDPASYVTRDLGISDATITFMHRAMRSTVTLGTARRAFADCPITVAGKTGTAQTSRGTNHLWFVGFAPWQRPQVAFAVVIEDQPEGVHAGELVCPLARSILEALRRIGGLDEG